MSISLHTTSPKLGAHLVTTLVHLHVRNLARRNSLEAESTREKTGEGRGGGGALLQQVINNSAAVQQKRGRMRRYV
jgi:hypothetical protein